jgi:hypothetical protein
MTNRPSLIPLVSSPFVFMFIVSITIIANNHIIASEFNCELQNPNVTYSIIQSTCISNNTQILVQISNCPDIKDSGLLIPNDYTFNFTTTTVCWYDANFDCNLLQSNTIIESNITVSYQLPLAMKMWNNYQYCLRKINRLRDNIVFIFLLCFSLFMLIGLLVTQLSISKKERLDKLCLKTTNSTTV